MRLSIGLHAAAGLGLLAVPSSWAGIVSALIADHLVLTLAGLLPRCSLLGPNLTRLPSAMERQRRVALTFDDGPDPDVTPAVLDRLGQAKAVATFFCIGARAETSPDLVSEIVARGHRVENHSYLHRSTFSFFLPGPMQREVAGAQQVLSRLCARPPRYFRAPAGIRNPWLEPILASQGLHLASWTRRAYDTVETRPRRAAARLLRGLGAGDVLLLHDGRSAVARDGQPVVLELLDRTLDEILRRRLIPSLLP